MSAPVRTAPRASLAWKASRLALALVLPFAAWTPAPASEYSQPGIYDVDSFELDNGLRVVLKPRQLARNVSIQLMVNVGEKYFPCGRRETAHFLEHLLFTGTDRHSEIELDELIESHGGSWNAETSNDYTRYYVDIYSRNFEVGLRTLHEIITRSAITPENVESSRKIIFRERGGKPSRLREWLFMTGIFRSATTEAINALFPGVQYDCLELDEASAITREEVLEAWRTYYVPANMALVIVGDFDPGEARALLAETFATMPAGPGNQRRRMQVPTTQPAVSGVYESRLHPLVGSGASIYFLYRTDGAYGKHAYASVVLEDYFQKVLYNRIRIEEGLAYAPSADLVFYDDFGVMVLQSDADLEDVDRTIALLKQAIARLKAGDLDQAQLDAVKRRILLNEARGYESNGSFASFYADNAEDLVRYGRYDNYEDRIEQVSIADVRAAANEILRDDGLVVAVVRPTFTYTQFYVFLFVACSMAAVLAWRIARRLRRSRRRR